MEENRYCKRLIEVDLPIKKVSEYARREKTARKNNHISVLHIWWARRPLVACRAVALAALLPDPADPICPKEFIERSSALLKEYRDKRGGRKTDLAQPLELRKALLDFIADFSDWDNSNNNDFIQASRNLVKMAHVALGGNAESSPLILDPFAGGGAIPFEAMRIGADVFASDLNPIAVLINKVLLEYIPKYGLKLAEEVRNWGEWVKEHAKKEFSEIYPKDSDGATPIAFLWSKTIICEGPGCGAEVPLLQSLWLAQKGNNAVALRMIPNKAKKIVEFEIIENAKAKDVKEGTVRRGSATCPLCGYTTPVQRVREQLRPRNGGSFDARLYVIVSANSMNKKRYRIAQKSDLVAFKKAVDSYISLKEKNPEYFPTEKLPTTASGYFAPPTYGAKTFSDLFNQRQLLFARWLVDSFQRWATTRKLEDNLVEPARCCIALVIDRLIDSNSSQCWWVTIHGETIMRTFGRQAYPVIWDYAEINPLANSSRGVNDALENILGCLEVNSNYTNNKNSVADIYSAQEIPLPHDSCSAIITDPPYYNAIPYSDLADFYQVWLYRLFSNSHLKLFNKPTSPKEQEIVEMSGWDSVRFLYKTAQWYEAEMTKALIQGRLILAPNGIMVLVFAHKDTKAWEALLSAVISAGWIITASWPLSTENMRRLRAQKSATLESSIHLVCRPREKQSGELMSIVGDWRDILNELPNRIHEWMPRLAIEGVVGADAIFACLGPALEVFSKYSYVEKADGKKVELKEYLEQIWAAVAKEALNMIFQGAHTEGFEEDARLTAMWLWTLSTGSNDGASVDLESTDYTDKESASNIKGTGFSLEYDAARKIAQGLGAHLENLSSVIEIEGDHARLIPVGERVKYLFGKNSTTVSAGKKKKKENQITLFEEFNKVEEQGWSLGDEKSAVGKTILDRLHQAMILFGAGRADAMRRFLVEEGVGKDERFWRLAQAFSALYPSNTDEKRWVDGVLARKKGLGF